ncbi:MAG: response regulator [Sulfuriferula sp.]
MRLLLVEDDKMIGESISEALVGENHIVDWVCDGREAELVIDDVVYDLLLLDLGLPKKQGLALLRDYRKRGGMLPVLVITARDSIADRVTGLDAGADDYLVKPFELEELFARMRALLRRPAGRAQSLIIHGDLTLDPVKHEAYKQGQLLNISAREFALLQTLLSPPGRVWSLTQLEEKLYGWDRDIGSNAIEVYIYHLRKKLGSDFIRNVRGVGYKVSDS